MNNWAIRGWSVKIALIACVSVFISLLLGKDLNWDLVNYHLYAPHMAEQGRLALDFMGGGPQSYFNPLALWPFYAMVKQGWHPILIGVILALAHSLNLIFVFLLAREIVFRGDQRGEFWSWVAVALAALSPVYWGLVGSSFSDAWVSIPIMAALWAMGRSLIAGGSLRWILLSGLLMGAAVGLKLSASCFFIAGAVAVLAIPPGRRGWSGRLRACLGYCLAATAGWLLISGWWSLQLYREFGNPVFPLMNQLFASPDYPAGAVVHSRFTPTGWQDYFWFPFWMALTSSWVYVENNAPDIRPAVLVVTLLISLGLRLTRAGGAAGTTEDGFRYVGTFLLFSYVIWYALSGNGRYAVPILLMIGLVQAKLLTGMPRQLRPGSLAVLLMIVQGAVFFMSGNPRWNPVPWGDKWVEVNVPERLREKPHGFISLQLNSASFVAPFMPNGSGFLGLQGQLPLYPGEIGAARAQAFISRYDGKLEALLYAGEKAFANLEALRKHPGLDPWGLEIRPETCIRLSTLPNPAHVMAVYSCSLQRSVVADLSQEQERKQLTPLFDKVQRACPKLFAPADWPLVKQGPLWVRQHFGQDIIVFMRKNRFYYSRQDFGPFDVDLGSVEDWKADRAHPDCAQPPRHYLKQGD